MRYLLAVLQIVVAATFVRRWALGCVWIAALLSSLVVVGCGPAVSTEGTVADLKLVQEQLRPLCWEPPEVTAAKAKGDSDIFLHLRRRPVKRLHREIGGCSTRRFSSTDWFSSTLKLRR